MRAQGLGGPASAIRQEVPVVAPAVRSRPEARALSVAADLLRVLGAPHRLAIVMELAEGPRCVHELVDVLGISQSLASQHLRVLRNIGLVTGTRRGKETAYSLADSHVAHIASDAVAHSAEPALSRSPSFDPNLEPTTEEEHES